MKNIRRRCYELLQVSEGGVGRALDVFLIALITINVTAVIFETVEELHSTYEAYFNVLEVFSVLIFSIEYLARIYSCVEDQSFEGNTALSKRLKFAFTPMAIIDFLAIAPFFLAYIFQIDLRFLRILRLIRIFKLTRYSGAMTTMLDVLREELNNLVAAIFIMLVIMVLAASGIYMVEHNHQPEVYGSIPQSMWWAIVTLTTVGYGDVTPVTLVGKCFAGFIMLAGVGLVALPTGILASSFSENLHRNKSELAREVKHALEDGVIDESEQRELDELCQRLGISSGAFEEIIQLTLTEKSNEGKPCPHCGKDLSS